MGQRLNIEIWKDGKVLANAYYHWSAYSVCAADMARKIIYRIPDIKEENDTLKAIRLLECTGAKLTGEEAVFVNKIAGLEQVLFDTDANRNDGIISVSENSIRETRQWQEGSLIIYLDEERLKFKVYWENKRWEWEKEQENNSDTPKVYKDLKQFAVAFDDIKFKTIDDFYEFVRNNEMEPFVVEINPDMVINMIA